MRTIVLATLLPLAVCGNTSSADGVVPPSGGGPARSYAAAGFTGVGSSGPDDVAVMVGRPFAVRAEGDPAVLDRLRIEVRDGELHVGRRRGISINGGKARITVSLPALRAAALAGSGNMTVDRVTGGALDASVAGSGSMRIGAVAVERAKVSIAGSGDIAAAGRASVLNVDVAGSGSLIAPQLIAGGADVTVAGSGDVRATVNGRATVSLVGSGDVDLGPRARCRTSRMGSGSVRCGG